MGPRQRRSAYVESSRVSPPTGPYSVPSSNTGGLAAAARRGTLIPSRATRAQPVHMGSSSTVAAGTPRNRSRDGAPLCTLGWHRELRVWQGGDSTYEQFSCLTNCDFLPFGHRADTECNCSSLPQRLTCDRDRSGCSGELLWKAHNGRAGWGAPSPQGPLNPVLVAYVQGQATPVQDSSVRTCWARSAGYVVLPAGYVTVRGTQVAGLPERRAGGPSGWPLGQGLIGELIGCVGRGGTVSTPILTVTPPDVTPDLLFSLVLSQAAC